MVSGLRTRSPSFISALGVGLLVVALVHHSREAATVGAVAPAVAFLLDGLPAVALVLAGRRLSRTDLTPDDRWQVWIWCAGGGLLFALAITLTFAVRAFEGRSLAEPVFPLLIAVEAGSLAGIVSGYYAARARSDARRARTVSEALSFVNDLLRHDLRNDLAAIRGRAQLLESTELPDDIDADTVVENADEAVERLQTTDAVVETLVGDADLEPIDLASIVAESATRIDATTPTEVTTDLPDRAPVTANAGLRSVVDNLIENAVEHNDATDPWVRATVECRPETVRLAVTDNGPGIPDDRKEAVFETDGSGRGGLVIVRTLVDGYGGEVWVEDRERSGGGATPDDPRGSTFVVELPAAD
jgi:signal transduction histidine kinase